MTIQCYIGNFYAVSYSALHTEYLCHRMLCPHSVQLMNSPDFQKYNYVTMDIWRINFVVREMIFVLSNILDLP